MSSHYPFRARTVLAVAALAAAAWLVPGMATAQTGQQATLSAGAKAEAPKTEAMKPVEAPPAGAGGNASVQSNPAQKSIAARAVDKVKDVFARVPCLTPKGGY